ncbi:hypothetical protein [Streptomyces gilvifuscus]|uniref:Uncharacterized protein n=1 Tax=Streptomyces gilvifuscus TaxID=1550617 RepID=A0ABT5G977_9ACTN|nr:hypothetical protein [Streptomyces gilvifuscus]MDC2961433.1 hypothetical protein [Streptomyces gilvifuscus]
MIRIGRRLRGPFHISGGPIVAFFVLLLYAGVVVVWVIIGAAAYLGLGIAYLVETSINERRQRQAARLAVER